MGEIATWSAVKTKVGLGKDSNECPTKAELLALSPTGTGENYVGLEISNASSYGNNETVQLSDIHKVTYRYAFTVVDTVLNFPALGGYSTPRWFGLGTTKQKQIDGVAIGDTISVGYTQSAYPDWIVYDEGYKASENTTLNQRSTSFTFTQNESGKQITVQFTQDAGVETWEYTFSVQNPNLNYTALGGSATPAIAGYNSFKQRYINGKPVGTSVDVGFSSPDLPSWIFMDDENHYTALENKSENSRSQVFTSTQNESGKKVTVTFAQLAGVKTYGTPTVYLGSIADIPASGGTAVTPTYTYSQLWGWNGKTDDGGTISSGASVVWSENISGSNLGTTAKARTKLGSRTLTVTLNGKSGSASVDIYQAQNRIENTTQGAWVVSISANPSTFTEQGGTSQITASARASRTNHWTSGATSAAADATGTPTLSIPTPSTGFSLSDTTLTVAENSTANERSVIVRATMDTVYEEITVTQSAYLVEWVYTMITTQPTLNFDALGTMQTCTITSYREKYINGSLVEGSMEGVNIRVKSSNAYIASTGSPNIREITMFENKTTNSRVGEVVYEQYDSGKTQTITCNQAAGTVTTRDVLEVISNFPDAPAAMGTNKVKGSVKCGYYDVINGKDSTWHSELPTVKAKSSYITNVDIGRFSSTQIDITCTVSDNTSESSRRLSVDLTYGSKEIELACTQAGANIGYNYQFEVTTDFPSVAAAGATPKAVVKSRRYRVVNGVQESSYTLVDLSVYSKPDWTGVLSVATSSSSGAGADKDVTLPVYENTSASIRRGTVVLQQSGSNKQITLNINQAAASITYQYTFEITDPSSKVINVPAKPIDPEPFSVYSFKTKVINGTVTSETTRVGVTVDAIDENWLEVSVGGMGEGEVTCLENRTSSIRSVTVTIRQEESGNLDQIDINQAAADIKVTYDLRWALSDRGNTFENRVNEYSLDTGGEADRLHLFLLCDKITKIGTEEISRTPVQTGLSNLTTAGPVYTDIGGEPSAIIQDDGGQNIVPTGLFPELKDYPNCYNIVIGSRQNLGLVQEEISMTFNKPVMDGTTQIGKVPTFLFYVDAVPYSQVIEYQFRGAGGSGAGSTYDVIVPASDGTGYFSIISFRAYTRNGVEFKREYLEPTFTAPTGVTIIKNGQNSDNSYDYALKVTDNPGDDERQWDIPFVNPVTGSQIHLYLTQEAPAVEQLTCELGNYYDYQASDFVNMGFGWSSKDGGDSIGFGGMTTPGGYLGARIFLPAGNDSIDMSAVGTPTYAKPLKIRLANIRKEKKEGYGSVTFTGLSVGYSQQDYRLGIVMGVGMESYFQLTPSILSESGDQGGGLQIQVTLKQTYNGYQGDSIADITLTPKDSNLPTLYLNIAWGNP